MIGPAVNSTHGSGTVDVHLIPTSRDDEVDHMPVSGTRMHLGGLAFILLLEHGVRHSVRTQSTELVEARDWSCISQSHVCP